MSSLIFISLILMAHRKEDRVKILMDLFTSTLLRVLSFYSLSKNEFRKYNTNLIKDHVSIFITKIPYGLLKNYCLTQKLLKQLEFSVLVLKVVQSQEIFPRHSIFFHLWEKWHSKKNLNNR